MPEGRGCSLAEAAKKYDGGGLPEKVAVEYFDSYESKEFTVANSQTNYNVKTQVTDAFTDIVKAHAVIIRTDQTITVRFNSTDNDAATITASEGQLVLTSDMRLEITNIFITNSSGATANVKIMLFP